MRLQATHRGGAHVRADAAARSTTARLYTHRVSTAGLSIIETCHSGECTTDPSNDVDGANVRVLLDTTETATESLHDAKRCLDVVVVAEMSGTRAGPLFGPTPRIEAAEDQLRVELGELRWRATQTIK